MSPPSDLSSEFRGGGTGLLAPPNDERRHGRHGVPSDGEPPLPPSDGDGGGGGGDDDEEFEEEGDDSSVSGLHFGWLVAAIATAAALLLIVSLASDAWPGLEGKSEIRNAANGSLLLVTTSGTALICALRESKRGRQSVARNWLAVTVLSGLLFAAYVVLIG